MKQLGKVILMSALALFALIMLIALLTGANFLFFWSILGYVQRGIVSATGLDSNLAKAIAALVVSLIVILPIGRMIRSFSPIPQRNKGGYRSLVFLLFAGFFLLAYLGKKDVYFDPQDGEAKMFYSVRNGEYEFFDHPGYDPLTGEKLRPVTKDIILKSKGWYNEPVSQPLRTPVYNPPPPTPPQDPVPENRDDDENVEEAKPSDNRNTSGNSWGLIERGNTSKVIFKNWYGEPITVYNLANEEKCVVSPYRSHTQRLVPGRYRYYRNGEKAGSFEVLEGEDRDVEFGKPEQRSEPIAKESDRIATNDQKGTLICQNNTSGLLRVCNSSDIIVLTVPAHQEKKIELPPGRYKVYFGNRREYLEVKADQTQIYEYVSGTKTYVVHRRR